MSLRFVECPAAYRLADYHAVGASLASVHFAWEREHRQIHFDAKSLRPFVERIESVGIAADEMDRNHISSGFYALGDEGLAPRGILNLAVYYS